MVEPPVEPTRFEANLQFRTVTFKPPTTVSAHRCEPIKAQSSINTLDELVTSKPLEPDVRLNNSQRVKVALLRVEKFTGNVAESYPIILKTEQSVNVTFSLNWNPKL